ncbi:MAG: hypothetical protein ACYTF7_01940 [Planctomycetota bacterium]|jgi:hypothetical protein
MRLLVLTALLLLPLPVAPARAQESEPQTELHPAIRLGMRVNAIKSRWPVAPVLVIVRDEQSFLLALEQWSQRARFPILLDDGSSQSREHIARFHRAFAPERALLFEAQDSDETGFSIERVDTLIARIWSNSDTDDRQQAWSDAGFTPPGVVLLGDRRLGLGAAALAVGHGQPILPIDLPHGGRNGVLPLDKAETIHDTIRNALDTAGYDWSTLDDDIDALTLLSNKQTKVRDKREQIMALTDFLGRDELANRYAWVSAIQGSPAHAVYQAMCSLFIHPRASWLFNTYSSDMGAGQYEAGPARELLEEAQFQAVSFDSPNNTLRSWTSQTRTALSSPLLMINTSGNARWFHMGDDRVAAGALPLLAVPAAVHFIHSFSAQRPGDTRSILGQWERRGAFAYYGSCDEPYLSAFRPPPHVVARLLSGMPWGSAPRFDTPRLWKLNTFGDPLFTLAPLPPRAESPEFFEDERLADLDTRYRQALRSRDLASAASLMRWLNKDEDLLRLGAAMLDADEPIDPRLAEIALHVAASTGAPEHAPSFFRACEGMSQDDPFLKDLLWHALRPTLATMRDPATLALLQAHIRPESYGRDANDLLPIIGRLHGEAARRNATGRYRDEAPDAIQRRQFNKILNTSR